MSSPDPMHDPENMLPDEPIYNSDDWYQQYDEYLEWERQMNQINDEERV